MCIPDLITLSTSDPENDFVQTSEENYVDEGHSSSIEINYFKIEGRRIINLNYFFESLKSLKHHPRFNCGFEFNEIISEKKIGFNSPFPLKCKFCGNINILYSDNPNTTHTNVTTAAASGASYSCLDELSTALDIPPISKKTFFRHQNK
jgi:hypothetical protein